MDNYSCQRILRPAGTSLIVFDVWLNSGTSSLWPPMLPQSTNGAQAGGLAGIIFTTSKIQQALRFHYNNTFLCPSRLSMLSMRQIMVKARETFKNFWNCVSLSSEWDRLSVVCHSSKSISTRTTGNAGADPSSKSRLPTPIRSSLFLWKTTKPSPDREKSERKLKRKKKKINRPQAHGCGFFLLLAEEKRV